MQSCCSYIMLAVCVNVSMCLLLYAVLLLVNVTTAVVQYATVTMQCCCYYMFLPLCVNV